MKRLTLLTIFCVVAFAAWSQSGSGGTAYTGQSARNYISTGMPILLIAPDATSSGLGDAGVATTPDLYSAHWNNAKLAFIDGNMGFGLTYTPWLRNLQVGDMNLFYLSGYYRINNRSTAALGLTYFTLGDIDHTDADGNPIGVMHPNEFSIDGSYALMITEDLSLGATVRYIRSDLTNGVTVEDGSGHTSTKAANSVAADLGIYYQGHIDETQNYALGMHISNLGAKLSYSDDNNTKEFLPANLRIGGRYTNVIDQYNKVNVVLDVNKLLVPTPPLKDDVDSWAAYKNIGVMQGVFQSFADAPGGFSEELQELQLSVGAEYWYAETFVARAGYFFEHENKGGRQYVTIGAGVRFNIFAFDLSYLIPTTKISTSPLANTIRIGLSVVFKPTK